jgi:hypothetical protein
MAAIQWNDGSGTLTLRNVYPAPANRFSNWTPMSKPFGDAVNRLSDGGLVMMRYRTDYGASFDLVGLGVQCGPAPRVLSIVTSTTGGALPAATYYYKVTAILPSGETGPSQEVSITTTGATSSITVTATGIGGATAYRFYRGTAAGAESVYYQTTGPIAFDSNGAIDGTASPPTAGVNLVALADRLVLWLMSGGPCAVYPEDTAGNSYLTCGLYPGTTPSLRLTDSQNLLYTLSLQLLNLAASPVAMHCVYA